MITRDLIENLRNVRCWADLRIGDKVTLAEHVEQWGVDELYVCGIRTAPDGLDITVSENWPPEPGITDGFFINRTLSPDDLHKVRDPAQIELRPKWAGQFVDHNHWVASAQRQLTGHKGSLNEPLTAICVDTRGRRCNIGTDFARARDESTFPVRFFFECVPVTVDTPAPTPSADHPAAEDQA